jgi:hypothetical protein
LLQVVVLEVLTEVVAVVLAVCKLAINRLLLETVTQSPLVEVEHQ